MIEENRREIIIGAANCLSEIRTGDVFRRTDNDFVVVFEDEEKIEPAFSIMGDALYEKTGGAAHISYVIVNDTSLFESAEEFFRVTFMLHDNMEDKTFVAVTDEAVEAIRKKKRMREFVEDALKDDRVEVYYQPMYDVARNRFISAEALVRIRDENGGIVMPGDFIPVAEESGLIVPLGKRIFELVCRFVSTGELKRAGLENIEINLSIVQIEQENLSASLLEIMEKHSVDPKMIILEITETASSKTKHMLKKNMKRLIANGVSFALDDFGTGRSNLDYFVEMSVSVIKFDYLFTQSYFTSRKARHVMESVVSMVHRMGLKLVSEGVETKEQFEAMKQLGVHLIQGFYFSKPLPKHEFIDFISASNNGADLIGKE